MEKPPKITDAEWTVMKILWKNQKCTSSDIINELSGSKDWSPTTIQTLISRLVEKKAIGYQKVGRTHHYYPLVTETNCLKEERQTFLKRLYDGSLSSLMAGFLEDEKLTPDEINRLDSLLEKYKKQKE